MRNLFDKQLSTLNAELTAMGALCEDAISMAIKALLEDEDSLLEQVFATETEINQKEREIEGICMKLLLQQQPVARDLRVISSALKMISDMERIGDQASDIAEITRYIQHNQVKSKIHIKDMASSTVKMVTDSIESFVQKDLALARSVIAFDDIVDDLFDRIKKELISLIGSNGEIGEYCIDLLMIAKYLERIGDHAVNVAEWVVYSITGKHVEDKEE